MWLVCVVGVCDVDMMFIVMCCCLVQIRSKFKSLMSILGHAGRYSATRPAHKSTQDHADLSF